METDGLDAVAPARLSEVPLARVNSRELSSPAPQASARKLPPAESLDRVRKAADRQSISDGELAALVRSMLAAELVDEPATAEPAAEPAAAETANDNVGTCCLCLCEEPRDKALECDNKCFACDECFSAHVSRPESLCTDHPGHVRCCASAANGCTATYTFQIAARHASPEAFDALQRNENERRTVAMQGEFEAWKQTFAAELAAKSEEERRLMFARKEIEELLSLRCPRCRQVFADYEGCAALTCAKSGCNAQFCALCLVDTNGDAHEHVKNCRLNPQKGGYHVSVASRSALAPPNVTRC